MSMDKVAWRVDLTKLKDIGSCEISKRNTRAWGPCASVRHTYNFVCCIIFCISANLKPESHQLVQPILAKALPKAAPGWAVARQKLHTAGAFPSIQPLITYLLLLDSNNIVLLQRRLCLKCIAHQQHEAQAESPLSSRDMEALLQDDEVIMPPTLPSNVSCHVHEYFRSWVLLS